MSKPFSDRLAVWFLVILVLTVLGLIFRYERTQPPTKTYPMYAPPKPVPPVRPATVLVCDRLTFVGDWELRGRPHNRYWHERNTRAFFYPPVPCELVPVNKEQP